MRRIKIKSKKIEQIEKENPICETSNKIYVENNAVKIKEKEQEEIKICKYYKFINNELVEVHERALIITKK